MLCVNFLFKGKIFVNNKRHILKNNAVHFEHFAV